MTPCSPPPSPRALGPLAALVLIGLLAAPGSGAAGAPIALHPVNPRYFLWRDQPTILISSAEHYGAVLNPDFDFRKYLATLQADGMNYTRVFTGGAYVEPLGAFNIPRNTLAPAGERFLAPWARSSADGYAGGGHRFDLTVWDPAYFQRLKDFLAEASKRGIVVEISLFCPFYGEEQWARSPFHPRNNVNQTPDIARTNVYTLDRHEGLLAHQERLVRKIVEEVRDFDNGFFEICNEPYFGGVTLDWQRHIAGVIQEAQSAHPSRKLIAQNIANGSARIEDPDPNVSIFNFHYAAPPVTVGLNAALQRVIGDDETGFRGTNDAPYRLEGWDFVMAGGGLYNNLDYSFVVGHEDGTFVTPASAPGGGNPRLRQSLRTLGTFIRGFDFLRMQPSDSWVQGPLPAGLTARALVLPGEQYAVYVAHRQPTGQCQTASVPDQPVSEAGEGSIQFAEGAVTLRVDLPAGDWRVAWVDPQDGGLLRQDDFAHDGGRRVLAAPAFREDVAIGIRRSPRR